MKHTPTRWPRTQLLILLLIVATMTPQAATPKFYPDDPIAREIDDRDASKLRPVNLSPTMSGWQAVRTAGDNASRPAMNVNTVGEVPDSNWFTNRIGHRDVSLAELVRGPDTLPAPPSGPWTVVAGKSDGVTPGLRLKDAAGRLFFVKFDPPGHSEMASGAEIVATKLLYALGYWVPENYIATLRRADMAIGPQATFKGPDGKKRPMTAGDLDHILGRAARNADGSFRMMASLSIEGRPVGPFQYSGTRPDDPNDIVPHEHRRELRALRVFAAWLNHVDTKSQNSFDTLVKEGPRQVVRHYLLDFGSTLGSAGTEPKNWRDGYEYAFEGRTTLLALLTFGAHTPSWRRIHYPPLPAIGRIDGRHFDPEMWKPTLPNPAFQHADADDTFWAAQRVMAFSDDAIRAVVATAGFSDPAATQYLSHTLIERRDAIGRSWLMGMNPVVSPSMNRLGQLVFRNAAWDAALTTDQPQYHVRWSFFDNASGAATPLGPWTSVHDTCADGPAHVPPATEYLMAEIAAMHARHPLWAHPVHAYFRLDTAGSSWVLVGFERPRS
jgi:hypothetical protein